MEQLDDIARDAFRDIEASMITLQNSRPSLETVVANLKAWNEIGCLSPLSESQQQVNGHTHPAGEPEPEAKKDMREVDAQVRDKLEKALVGVRDEPFVLGEEARRWVAQRVMVAALQLVRGLGLTMISTHIEDAEYAVVEPEAIKFLRCGDANLGSMAHGAMETVFASLTATATHGIDAGSIWTAFIESDDPDELGKQITQALTAAIEMGKAQALIESTKTKNENENQNINDEQT